MTHSSPMVTLHKPLYSHSRHFNQDAGLRLSSAVPDKTYSNASLYWGLKMDGPGYRLDETPPLGRLAWWSPSIRVAPEVQAEAV